LRKRLRTRRLILTRCWSNRTSFGAALKNDCYFSIRNSTENKDKLLLCYLEANSSSSWSKKEEVNIAFKPHEVQEVTLLLVLGIAREKLESCQSDGRGQHGKGKSIALAILSAYLAAVGYNVRCSCYSQYPSERDQSSFKELFECLSLDDKIRYRPFSNFCEEILNTGQKDFTEEAKKMILAQPTFNRVSATPLHLNLEDENEVTGANYSAHRRSGCLL
jgi:hypothetical protein